MVTLASRLRRKYFAEKIVSIFLLLHVVSTSAYYRNKGGMVDLFGSSGRLTSSKPQIATQGEKTNKLVEIKYLHIFSDIRFRYARTRVLASIKNHGNAPITTYVTFKIPKEEFVTKFSIETNGSELVQENVVTNDSSDTPVSGDRNRIRGILKLITSTSKQSRECDEYKMILHLIASEELRVTVVYEGLVNKIAGNGLLLSYELHIKPEQLAWIKSYQVRVNIREPSLTRALILSLRGKKNRTKIIQIKQTSRNDKREILWSPSDNELKELIREDLIGEVKIQYNIMTQNQDNNIVWVRDGYFAYYDDKNLKIGDYYSEKSDEVEPSLLPRHVVFVLDVSASMEGHRLKQLEKGISRVLNAMTLTTNYKDTPSFIDIVTFSNKVNVWTPLENTVEPYPWTQTYKKPALNLTRNLKAGGSTNIFAALKEGLRLALRAQKWKYDAKSIIFFVTDGEPTSGVVDMDEIRRRMKELNVNGSIPIYSLAFGSEADFEFCKNISSDTNGGLARKIFDLDTEDAAASFETFYRQIASPSLQNVTFKYTTPPHFVNEVTHAQLLALEYNSRGAEIQKMMFGETTYEVPCAENCLLERIFALKKIKKLYKLHENQTLPSDYCTRAQLQRRRRRTLKHIREANILALKHNFITPCTTLIIRQARTRLGQSLQRRFK